MSDEIFNCFFCEISVDLNISFSIINMNDTIEESIEEKIEEEKSEVVDTSFDSDDTIQILKVLKQHEQNWTEITRRLKTEQHRVCNKSEDQIKKHISNICLKSSKYRRSFKRAKYIPPKKSEIKTMKYNHEQLLS